MKKAEISLKITVNKNETPADLDIADSIARLWHINIATVKIVM